MTPPASARTHQARVRSRFAALLATLALCGAVIGCDGEALRGTAVDPAQHIPALPFVRHDGSLLQFGPTPGALTVVFFGYTRCPDVCPTTLADWARAKSTLGDNAAHVRFVFVSVDPERDTAKGAQEYAARFDSTFVGVVGDTATTAAIERHFGIATIRSSATAGHNHTIMHSPRTFLLDELGRLIAMYSYGSGWDVLASDLKKLT